MKVKYVKPKIKTTTINSLIRGATFKKVSDRGDAQMKDTVYMKVYAKPFNAIDLTKGHMLTIENTTSLYEVEASLLVGEDTE